MRIGEEPRMPATKTIVPGMRRSLRLTADGARKSGPTTIRSLFRAEMLRL